MKDLHDAARSQLPAGGRNDGVKLWRHKSASFNGNGTEKQTEREGREERQTEGEEDLHLPLYH